MTGNKRRRAQTGWWEDDLSRRVQTEVESQTWPHLIVCIGIVKFRRLGLQAQCLLILRRVTCRRSLTPACRCCPEVQLCRLRTAIGSGSDWCAYRLCSGLCDWRWPGAALHACRHILLLTVFLPLDWPLDDRCAAGRRHSEAGRVRWVWFCSR